jgi:hypothetical protein
MTPKGDNMGVTPPKTIKGPTPMGPRLAPPAKKK